MKRFFHRKYFNKRKENKDKNHVDGIDWIVTIVFQEFLIDIEQKKEKEREKSKTTLCLIDTLRNKKRVKSFRDFFSLSFFLIHTTYTSIINCQAEFYIRDDISIHLTTSLNKKTKWINMRRSIVAFL